MDTPQVTFKTFDFTDTVSNPTDGISFVIGKASRGPINTPSEIFNNWPTFVKRHGNLSSTDDALLIKRVLEKGGRIRFAKLAHYTTISNASTLTALKAAAVEDILDADDVELFELVPKYAGADYNNLTVVISAASNGSVDYFNLSINHALEPTLNESYENLTITGGAGPYNYLKEIVDGSELMDVVYKDITALSGVVSPVAGTITYEDGDDGDAIVDADVIGDTASTTGYHAFDEYDDSYQIFVLGNPSDAVHVAGDAYAIARQDLHYWGFLSNTLVSATQLAAKRTSLNMTTEFSVLFGGGLKVTDPVTGQPKNLEAITDIAALAAASDTNFGPFYSFSGNKRGRISNALGVVNNFGTPAKHADLNLLANRQINMLINTNGQIKLWNGFTTFVSGGNSQRQFISVIRGMFFIKKALKPKLEDYLEEPCDIPTWKLMYRDCKTFLDDLVTRRAIDFYEWHGDQDVANLDELQINTKANVKLGKYKVKLILSFIVGMQAIEIDLIMTNGVLSFGEINELTN